MAFCLIVWKVIKVWRALSRIKRVKLNAYRESIGLPPKYGCCYSCWLCFWLGLKSTLLRICCPCFFWKTKDGRTTWEVIWTDGTLANSILKSLCGLIVGLILTHLTAIFLIFQLNFDPITTTYASILFGTILTLGLAFSVTSRCFVFLTLPQFFTKKGRAAILAYCLILALSGPGKNTTRNMEILTESLLCSQEMAHNATQGLIDLVKDPYSALGGALKAMVDAVKKAADSIMASLRHLINMITAVVNAIKAVLKWLKEIMSFCNTKVGSPSTKCRAAFDEAIEDCGNRLGSAFKWMCSVVDLVKNLCYLAEWTEGVICWLPGLIKENVLDPIKNGLKDVGAGIKTFFDVRIRFDYELEGSFTSSKSFREVVRGMKGEILEEIHWLLDYMDWVNILASLFMGLALYKALIYRYRFLTIDRHDNFFITKGIVQLDLRMRRIGREPLFPLKYRESFTFVQRFFQPFSLVLVESEKKALKHQLLFVGIATVKILIYIFIDYILYLFLLLVQKYGAFHVDTRKLLGHGVKVSGHGFMAAMYRAILEALSPIGAMLPVFDTSPCLPIPSKPNYYRYVMIFFLLLLCFMACVTEPYGMRFRHVICGIYYPERKLPRDRWLYTHILTSRGNFISYARNELRSMLSNGKSTYRIGLVERLSHTSPCFRKLFELLRMRRKKCFLCGLSGDMDDMENFVHCPSCDSIYCSSCYEEVGGRCVGCMSPIEFGDISEESGSHSSDPDDVEAEKEIARILKRRKRRIPSFQKKLKRSTTSEDDDQRSPLLPTGSDSDSGDSLTDITIDRPFLKHSADTSPEHNSKLFQASSGKADKFGEIEEDNSVISSVDSSSDDSESENADGSAKIGFEVRSEYSNEMDRNVKREISSTEAENVSETAGTEAEGSTETEDSENTEAEGSTETEDSENTETEESEDTEVGEAENIEAEESENTEAEESENTEAEESENTEAEESENTEAEESDSTKTGESGTGSQDSETDDEATSTENTETERSTFSGTEGEFSSKKLNQIQKKLSSDTNSGSEELRPDKSSTGSENSSAEDADTDAEDRKSFNSEKNETLNESAQSKSSLKSKVSPLNKTKSKNLPRSSSSSSPSNRSSQNLIQSPSTSSTDSESQGHRAARSKKSGQRKIVSDALTSQTPMALRARAALRLRQVPETTSSSASSSSSSHGSEFRKQVQVHGKPRKLTSEAKTSSTGTDESDAESSTAATTVTSRRSSASTSALSSVSTSTDSEDARELENVSPVSPNEDQESQSSTTSDSTSNNSESESPDLNPFCIQPKFSTSGSDTKVPEFLLHSKRSRSREIPRKRIDSSLAERVARLDSFYSKMPYPPCSNVYK